VKSDETVIESIADCSGKCYRVVLTKENRDSLIQIIENLKRSNKTFYIRIKDSILKITDKSGNAIYSLKVIDVL
jgi:hypothetical protein